MMNTQSGNAYIMTIPKAAYTISCTRDGKKWKVTHCWYQPYSGCDSTWNMNTCKVKLALLSQINSISYLDQTLATVHCIQIILSLIINDNNDRKK